MSQEPRRRAKREKDDLVAMGEKPTVDVDPVLAAYWSHQRAMRQMLFDFIIDLIDHGGLLALALIGLLLVALGRLTSNDVVTIIGAVAGIGGGVGAGVRAVRGRTPRPPQPPA